MTPHGDDGADLLLRDVTLRDARCDVLVLGGRIAAVGAGLARPTGVEELVGGGGELLPGLHDHHLHLAATAAAMRSLSLGPPTVSGVDQFVHALRSAPEPGDDVGWIRAVDYHESVAGPLDRHVLDSVVSARPVRVQDRSGARWTLNSCALRLVGAAESSHPGIERDRAGEPTGVLHRADEWLASRRADGFPDLADLGRRLSALGITGVTDCTPFGDASGPSAIAAGIARDELTQDVVLTGGIELVDAPAPPGTRWGPVKVVLDDVELPALEDLVDIVRAAHRWGRGLAVHAVTAPSLALALAAWRTAGATRNDRIEHGSVIGAGARDVIATLDVTVVTQPIFVRDRGDHYLAEVDPVEVPDLYRCGSLLALGIAVAAGSDAPYGALDPWQAVRTATDRRTRSGATMDASEAVSPSTALGLYLGDPLDPGRAPRRVAVGAVADLCLLGRPLDAAGAVTAADVRACVRAGRVLPR